MKLAQALIERADLQRKLAQLGARLQQNAQYQEGEAPAEDPQDLLTDYRRSAAALTRLIIAINCANHNVTLADGTTMLAALAERDRLKAEHAMLGKVADAAMADQSRYSRSEIRTLAAVDIRALRVEADNVAKRCRELDIQIQQANWENDIAEEEAG
jgi:hypothetical protein